MSPRVPRLLLRGRVRALRRVVARRPDQRSAGRAGALAVRPVPARSLAPAALRARVRGSELAAARLRAIRAARREAGSPRMPRRPTGDGGQCQPRPPRPVPEHGRGRIGRYWRARLVCLLAVAISVVTVFFVWRAGRATGGREIGLLAALFVALLPMFAFRAGHVSNDALVDCCAAATTGASSACCASRSRGGRVVDVDGGRRAYLSKISAIALVPPFTLALLAAAPHVRGPLAGLAPGALGLAGVLVAPWTMRNVVLYGDPFASEAMRHAVAHIITDRSLFSSYFIDALPAHPGQIVRRRLRVGEPADAAARPTAVRGAVRGSARRRVLRAGGGGRLGWRARGGPRRGGPLGPRRRRAHQPAVHPAARPLSVSRPSRPWPSWSPSVCRRCRGRCPQSCARHARARCSPATSPRSWAWSGPPTIRRRLRTLDSDGGVDGVRPVLGDLALASTTAAFIVTGAEPWWLAPVDVSADAFGRVDVERDGSRARRSEQRACCVTRHQHAHRATTRRVASTGAPTGAPQVVPVVAGRPSPHWAGVVTTSGWTPSGPRRGGRAGTEVC